ncbi:DUF6087 family protein [Streptomyces griseofuscus]|uniref:DUF6087 family protein n=1 Tax=Streptomyces griseofuscus TaxID=146922 RepID=UPI0036FD32CF
MTVTRWPRTPSAAARRWTCTAGTARSTAAADTSGSEPRALEEWNGFSYEFAGTAANLAEAQKWVNEQSSGTTGGPGTGTRGV